MEDSIHTTSLNITLTPWPPWELEIVDQNHPWSLEKEHEFCIEGKIYNTILADTAGGTEYGHCSYPARTTPLG